MPQTTKRLLADQVMIYLDGGYPDVASDVQQEDIYKRIEQVLNAAFAMQQFQLNLPNGETIPNNLALATYSNVAVVPAYSGKSKSVLPAMPIFLPRNAGINEIRPVINTAGNEVILGNPFIPIIEGQDFLLQVDKLLNDLLGQISYSPNGMTVIYSKDLSTIGITAVQIKLVVFDMSQYGDSDILPIPSDMEDGIIQSVIKFFVPVTPEPGIVSNYPTPKANAQ